MGWAAADARTGAHLTRTEKGETAVHTVDRTGGILFVVLSLFTAYLPAVAAGLMAGSFRWTAFALVPVAAAGIVGVRIARVRALQPPGH